MDQIDREAGFARHPARVPAPEPVYAAAMQFALSLPNFVPVEYGGAGTLHRFVEWACAAERAGWDGFFIWDHLIYLKEWSLHVEDPWVLMAAIASATERIHIGTMITPLPRRRPWQVARAAVSLDHLSGGRLILGVGLGAPLEGDFEPFGEPTDNRVLAQRLDESLDIIGGLWKGEPISYQGQHYKLDGIQFLPRPLQTPRIPIWVAGVWPRKAPMRRAAKWDGVYPLKDSGDPDNPFAQVTPGDAREIRGYIAQHRADGAAFDVVVSGWTGFDRVQGIELLATYAEAGVTWWIEGLASLGLEARPERLLERIEAGPPRP